MKLTAKQEAYLSRFLRDINLHLGAGIVDDARESGLRQIQRDIYRQLQSAAEGQESLSDDTMFQVLRRLGKPEIIAARLKAAASPNAPGTSTSSADAPAPTPPQSNRNATPASASESTSTATMAPENASENRVWLGVCARLADLLDQDPRLVRVVVFLVGLVTGPLALFAYLAAGHYLHATAQIKLPYKPSLIPLLSRMAGYNGIILALHLGMAFLLRFIYTTYESLLQQLPPELTSWGWLEAWRGSLVFWMLAFGIPLSLLGGLPLANGWDHSLRRFLQAMIALYAVILCFGIASILVGLLLDSVEDIRVLIG